MDIDELTKDFVTHQAIHTYLTQEREASLPAADGDLADKKLETIEKLQGRLSVVVESALSSLTNAGELDRDDYNILVDVRAICPSCGTDMTVGELIRHESRTTYSGSTDND